MTDQNNLLISTKKEIRSILLPAQKGLQLHKLRRDYRDLLGKTIPFLELGFVKIEDFLYSIPDVVSMQWSYQINSYILQAVADESTKHIEKMVQKQKSTRQSRALPRFKRSDQFSYRSAFNSASTRSRVYSSPPQQRRSAPREHYSPPPRHATNYSASGNVIRPREHVPAPVAVVQIPTPISIVQSPVPVVQTPVPVRQTPTPLAYVKQQVIQLVEDSVDGINPSELQMTYKRRFGQDIDYQAYGFEAFEDLLDEVPRLKPEKVDGILKVYIETDTSNSIIMSPKPPSGSQAEKLYTWESNAEFEALHMPKSTTAPKRQVNLPRSMNTESANAGPSEAQANGHRSNVSEKVKNIFREILERNPRGIFGLDFPSAYKVMTGTNFDLKAFGYYSLIEMVDDLDDVFYISRPADCMADWQLFDVNSTAAQQLMAQPEALPSVKTVSPAILDNIISNIRRILLAYPEGVYVDDFIHIYSLNVEAPLMLKDMGFDDITKFFYSIEHTVPLILNFSEVRTKVCMPHAVPVAAPTRPHRFNPDNFGKIPLDAVLPGEQYLVQQLPQLPNDKFFFEMYTGSIDHPGQLWIQLRGKTTSIVLSNLIDQLERLYAKDVIGREYVMLDCHIVVGAICAGVWDYDAHWYRVIIASVDMDHVRVFYVDYGNYGKIPKCNLRYLKKEFIQLPAQAIKSRMACVVPRNGEDWSTNARDRLLEICKDKPLMGQIISNPLYPEHLSLWICDCTQKEDIHLNQLLYEEGYAVMLPEGNSMQGAPGFPPQQAGFVMPNMGAPGFSQPTTVPTNWGASAAMGAGTPDTHEVLKAIMTIMQFHNASSSETNVLGSLLQTITANAQNQSLEQLLATNANSILLNQTPGNQLPNPLSLASNAHPYRQNLPCPSSTNFIGSSPMSMPGMMKSQSGLASGIEPPRNPTTSGLPNANYIRPPMNPSPGKLMAPSILEDDDDSEIFEDDDDEESFNRICEQVGGYDKKFVHWVKLLHGYEIHIVVVDRIPYVTSGDLNRLFWSGNDENCFLRRMQRNNISVSYEMITEEKHPMLFKQLRCYRVKGIVNVSGKVSAFLYRLADVNIILNTFGHPSPTIREEIENEFDRFDPDSELWQSFSAINIEDQAGESYETDSDKFYRMCALDLKGCMEGLKFKKLKISKMKTVPNLATHPDHNVAEIDLQYQRYERRLREIEGFSAAASGI